MADTTSDDFAKDVGAMGQTYDDAPSESTGGGNNSSINWPGRYLVAVRSIKGKEDKNWPNLSKHTDGRWFFNLCLEQLDDQETSPKGSTMWHSITVMPSPDAPQKKKEDTARFAKPQLCALFQNSNFDVRTINKVGINTYNSAGGIVEHHKMTGSYMVDITVNKKNPRKPDGTINLSVNKIDVAKPGEKTIVAPRDDAPVTAAAQTGYNAGTVDVNDANPAAEAPGGLVF